MTDIEITRKCAEKMGYNVIDDFSGFVPPVNGIDVFYSCTAGGKATLRYYPLHDDAQAMALVRQFSLMLCPIKKSMEWMAFSEYDGRRGKGIEVRDRSINRAICECVAQLPDKLER